MRLYDRRFVNVIQLMVDLSCMTLIGECTVQARIAVNPWLTAHVWAGQANAWAPSLSLIVPLWLLTSFRFRLYRLPEKRTFWATQVSALENAVVLTMITAVVTFFSRQFGESTSRMYVPVMLPVAFVILLLGRYLVYFASLLVQQQSKAPLRVALVSGWERGSQLIGQMHKWQAQSFLGLIVPEKDFALAQGCAMPVLGTTRQIAELINKERLDRVVLLNASLPSVDLDHCSQILQRMGVPVSCALHIVPDRVQMGLSTNYGSPLLELIPAQFSRRQEIIKRTFDVIVSAVSILALSPVLLGIALLIKVSSAGPVLYKSSRIGKGGRYFTFLKFRSMYSNNERQAVADHNEKNGHIFKMRNDPRVTPLGRFIRRYSLDELPQIINILVGEMSFVGPRPLPACDLGPDGMSKQYTAWSEGRAKVHPGLTGLWQISGRSDLAFEDMVQLDLFYLQNWSLALDVRILLQTPMLVLRGQGAY